MTMKNQLTNPCANLQNDDRNPVALCLTTSTKSIKRKLTTSTISDTTLPAIKTDRIEPNRGTHRFQETLQVFKNDYHKESLLDLLSSFEKVVVHKVAQVVSSFYGSTTPLSVKCKRK